MANGLHGNVERAGNAVPISVEPMNAVTGYESWSQHHDDTVANIFAVQDKVSHAIAQARALVDRAPIIQVLEGHARPAARFASLFEPHANGEIVLAVTTPNFAVV